MTAEVDDPRVAVLGQLVERQFGDLLDRPSITPEQLAKLDDIGRSAAYEACRRGDVPAYQVGGRWRIGVAALVAQRLGVDVREVQR